MFVNSLFPLLCAKLTKADATDAFEDIVLVRLGAKELE